VSVGEIYGGEKSRLGYIVVRNIASETGEVKVVSNIGFLGGGGTLGALAKLQKATVSFVVSVCLSPSVRPHGTTQLPLDGFFFK
jgi:hypothetical protein